MMNHIKYYVFLLTFIACSNENSNIPEDIIAENQFTQVLTDIQLVEAHLNEFRPNQIFIKDSIQYFYNEIFNRYHTTQDQFIHSISYYSKKPTQLKEIYDNVLNNLSEMEAELSEVQIKPEIIVPVDQQVLLTMISESRISKLYQADSNSIDLIRDSVFKFFILNDSILDRYGINVKSFQQSYNSVTHPIVKFATFKEQVLKELDKKKPN